MGHIILNEMALVLLSEVGQKIRQYLPQILCLEEQNYYGHNFLRLFSAHCDEYLTFAPPVEILITHKNNEELNVTLVNYRREVLEETSFRYCDQDSDTGQHTYILYVQKMLCQTQLVLCLGASEEKILSQFSKIRKSDLLLCLIEKSIINKGEMVFRAKQCRQVNSIEEVDEETGLCRECTNLFNQLMIDGERET